MSELIKLGKKVFTVGVVATTIFWSVGLATLAPAVANAADVSCPTLNSGDMVKVSGKAAIYTVNNSLQILYFPSGDEFKSWRPTYGGYKTITQACFDSLSVPSTYPGAVNYRPGSYVVKRPSSDQLYVVEPGNTLAKITEEAAKALYGATFKVMTVNDAFWPHYVNRAADVTEAKVHPGMTVSNGGKTWYVNTNNTLSEVTAEGMTANAFQARFVYPVADSAIAGLTADTNLTAEVKALTDKTQSGGVVENVLPPVTGGALSVSLASDTPTAGTLAGGTAYNKMLKLNLTAGSDKDTKVTGITITRTGLIANTNISGVSVWDRMGYRHGDVMTSVNSNNQVTIGFGSNPIVVARGTTETLTVAFNLATAATSGTVGASVLSAADVLTDGTVSGSFPVVGNTMGLVDGSSSLSTYSVAAVSPAGALVTTAGNVEIGQTKEIGKFKFTETSGINDIAINQVTFYLEGTLKDKDLQNFTLIAPDNTVLGTTEWMSNRYVTINLTSPYIVPKSNNRTLTLQATVVDGSGNNFRAHIQNDYDVVVKDNSLGYGIIPANFTDQKADDGYFVMKSGTLTLSKNSTSPSGNISAGSSNIVLAKFDIKAVGEDMEIRKIGVKIATTVAAGYPLSGNITLRVGNDVLVTFSGDYTAALYSTGSQRNLSQYLTIKSGETKTLEVVGNINSNSTTDTYQVSIGNFYAKRLSTLDYADGTIPSALYDTAANQLSVQSTNLTFNKDTSMGNKTIAKGSVQTIGQYVIQAGNAEDVRMSNVSVKFGGTGSVSLQAANTFQNLELYDGATLLGSTVSSVASSSNNFSFTLPVAKNQTKVLTLKALVLSGAGNGNVSTTIDSYTYTGVSTGNTQSVTDDVGGQTITVGSAAVTITAVTDATSASKIYGPSGSTEVQLGKWKLAAANESVTLNKLTLTVKDDTFADDTAAGNFGTLSLYDGSTKLGSGSFVAGKVAFTGLSLTVPADGYKTLTLKGAINPSGTMNSSSTNTFVITDNSNTNMEIRSGSGALLAATDINTAALTGFATSTFYEFHDAVASIANNDLGTSLETSASARIFKFTITNTGTRDLRLTTTTINVNVSGLTASAAFATGTIGTWKLYEDNGSGGLGTLLSTATDNGLAGGAGVTGYDAQSSGTVTFGDGVDENSMFDNFVISAGASRTFIMTADTTDVLDGKTQGVVTVSASLAGSTGWNGTAWNVGNAYYFYTPVGTSTEVGPVRHSDSYTVTGSTLSRSL